MNEWIVYFVQQDMPDGHGPAKVGCTRSLYARRRELQVGSPYPLIVKGEIASFGTLTAHWMERSIHEQLHSVRMRGEWFRDDPLVWTTYKWFEEHGLAAARRHFCEQRGYPVDRVDGATNSTSPKTAKC